MSRACLSCNNVPDGHYRWTVYPRICNRCACSDCAPYYKRGMVFHVHGGKVHTQERRVFKYIARNFLRWDGSCTRYYCAEECSICGKNTRRWDVKNYIQTCAQCQIIHGCQNCGITFMNSGKHARYRRVEDVTTDLNTTDTTTDATTIPMVDTTNSNCRHCKRIGNTPSIYCDRIHVMDEFPEDYPQLRFQQARSRNILEFEFGRSYNGTEFVDLRDTVSALSHEESLQFCHHCKFNFNGEYCRTIEKIFIDSATRQKIHKCSGIGCFNTSVYERHRTQYCKECLHNAEDSRAVIKWIELQMPVITRVNRVMRCDITLQIQIWSRIDDIRIPVLRSMKHRIDAPLTLYELCWYINKLPRDVVAIIVRMIGK